MKFALTDKKPVFIFSSPRTGSTALAYHIERQLRDTGIKLFTEIDFTNGNKFIHQYDPTTNLTIKVPINEFNVDDYYIFKVHLLDLLKYMPEFYKEILQLNGMFIRLRRKNITAQILSYYIETVRQVWGYTKFNKAKYENKDIDFYHKDLLKIVDVIQDYNQVLNDCKIKFDMDIFYEDLEIKESTNCVKTPKPNNYDNIYKWVNKQLDKEML